ncbi:MAG: potassium channel protein [Planctomycetota bacterium]
MISLNTTSADYAELRAMFRCALLLFGVVLVGTLGFHLIEETWSLWDCFYFTIVTITTVGYGDYGLCRNGQAFAAFLMVSGFGVFTYSLTTLVRIAADSDAARRRKMKRDIANCEGHIIVCGYGRVGQTICREVRQGGLDCVVIENTEEGAAAAMEDGRLVVEGDASDDATLIRAGVQRARGVVCAVTSDAENMFITVSARDLNPEVTIISRAESDSAGQKLRRAGASLVVSPHQMAGETVANAVLNPRLSKFMGAACDDRPSFRMGETVVHPGSELSGQTIAEFGGLAEALVFVAIEREDGEMVIRPRGYDEFRDGDVVIYAGSTADADFIRAAASSCAVCV